MKGEKFSEKFEISTIVFEDKLGRNIKGKSLDDNSSVLITVFDPQLPISANSVKKVLKTSLELSEFLSRQILHIIDAGRTEGGNFYIISEGCEWQTLKEFIASKGGLLVDESVSIIYQLCAGLRTAAGIGLCHCDLNPRSIFVKEIEKGGYLVRIARFGFHNLLPFYSPARKTEPFYGTPEYMAPEVCSGKEADYLSDIYSIGSLMYEMITGKPPFISNNFNTTIKRQIYEKPLPLHLVKPNIKNINEFEKIVFKCLQKDPKHRYADVTELMENLVSFRNEFYSDLPMELEQERETAPKINKDFLEGEVFEEKEVLKKEEVVVEEQKPRETMLFTGLAAEVREMEEIQARLKEKIVEEEKPPEEKVEEKPAEEFVPVEKPKKTDEWFVEDSEALPEEKEYPFEVKREPRTFFIIVGAVIVILIVGIALYLENRSKEKEVKEKSIETSFITPTPTKEPEKKPAVIPEEKRDIITPFPSEVETLSLVSAQPAEIKEDVKVKEEKLKEILYEAHKLFNEGSLREAEEKAKEALYIDPENASAKELISKIEEKKKEVEVKKPPPSVKVTPKKVVKKERPKPVPLPSPSEEEIKVKVGKYLADGRLAMQKEDYKTAIALFEKVLELDKNNRMAKLALLKAKAKIEEKK